MPLTLERVAIIPGVGRELPRVSIDPFDAILASFDGWGDIEAMNENHDELGRFASADGGGSHVAKVSESRKAYEAAKEAYKTERRASFEKAKAEHQASHATADQHANAVTDAIGEVSFPDATDRATKAFSKAAEKVDLHNSTYDESLTGREKYDHFAKAETLANDAIAKLDKVTPGALSVVEIADSKAALAKVAHAASQARQALRQGNHALRQAKQIRDGVLE